MLQEVRPSLFFWCCLGLFSSFAWLFSSLKMDFLNKTTTGLVAKTFLRLTIILSWFVANVLLYKVFMFLRHEKHDGFFRGYERVGKTFGSALLFFGNIGLYYYSEKSYAGMLTFLFLAFYCLCALFCVQPYTDFGVFEFLLGASLNDALSVFGIQSYSSWLVLIACIVMAGLRYWLEPTTIDNSKCKRVEWGPLSDLRRTDIEMNGNGYQSWSPDHGRYQEVDRYIDPDPRSRDLVKDLAEVELCEQLGLKIPEGGVPYYCYKSVADSDFDFYYDFDFDSYPDSDPDPDPDTVEIDSSALVEELGRKEKQS